MRKRQAVIAVVAILSAAGCADKATDANEAAEETTTTERSTTTTTEEPTTTTQGVDAAMAEWVDDSFPYTLEFNDLMGKIGSDAEGMDTLSMEIHCDELVELAQEARAETLPTPKPDLTSAWGGALDSYEGSGLACSVGAANMDVASLNQSAALLDEATEYLNDATAIMEDFTAGL